MRSSHATIIRCALAVSWCFLLGTHAIAAPPSPAPVQKAEPVVAVEKSLVRYRTRHIAAQQLVRTMEQLGLLNPRELRITIDDGRQEIIVYGTADEHAKLKAAIEMLDLDHPEEQGSKVQARGENIHVVPIGELPSEVLRMITSVFKSNFKFLTIHDGLMIAEGAEKDIDAIVELVERIERTRDQVESHERDEHQSNDAGDSISLRLLCLIENGGRELPAVEEPLASELTKLGYGQVAKITELRTSTSLNEISLREEFGVAGQIGDGLLETEFRILDQDGARNFVLSAEVAMRQDSGGSKSPVFRTRTTVQLPLGQWAVLAAAPAPEMKAGSSGVSQSRVILLIRADTMQLIEAK